ncbi:hypothetical protein L226DRAFT_556576 [Lentinus tigrinus ALCF2SS1-7]|uniref:Uncharacterized protein n=1 Tax=Lentinus tigrinus ALCF2SS1-6 TaxID=1328759 RepID=A0A5C2ST91_9APHY|nr:hypothetical protein L227DRAFT_596676 [Lentinus tigrinus ALCF2SS1-6]RPD80613.1 hypothetical protein L226DRAFT_556576 [Lentinus tigrinus ALCF2SS1-7]
MPLFGKSETFSENPEVREVEKTVAKEARADQKNLDHAISDLSQADKTHSKSIKSAEKAAHALDKAVANEHKAAKALNNAAHKHEAAIANEQTAEKTVQIKNQHQDRLAQDLEQRKLHLESLRQRKEHNDQVRETKLSDIHAREAAVAGTRSTFSSGDRASIVGGDDTDTAAKTNTGAAGAGGAQA